MDENTGGWPGHLIGDKLAAVAPQLHVGSNQIHTTINGQQVTIRAFLSHDGILQIVNAFVGISNRILSDGWAMHPENSESDVRELAGCFGESEKRSAAANGFSCRSRFPDGNPF